MRFEICLKDLNYSTGSTLSYLSGQFQNTFTSMHTNAKFFE